MKACLIFVALLISGSALAQQGPLRLQPNGSIRNTLYGLDLGQSGEELFVSTLTHTNDGGVAGAIQVLVAMGSSMVERQLIKSPDGGVRFGRSFGVSGDILVTASESNFWLYSRQGGEWKAESSLPMPEGFIVINSSISSDRAFFAMSSRDDPRFVQVVSISDKKIQFLQRLQFATEPGGLFGLHMCIDGEMLLVSDPSSDTFGRNVGSVYSYQRQHELYQLHQILTPTQVDQDNGFGGRMACFDSQVMIHTLKGGINTQFFEQDGYYSAEESLTLPVGHNVVTAIHNTGQRGAIVAKVDSMINGTSVDLHFVHLYHTNGHSWELDETLASPISEYGVKDHDGSFGWRVVESEKLIAVSSPDLDGNGPTGAIGGVGEVYVWLKKVTDTSAEPASVFLGDVVSVWPNPSAGHLSFSGLDGRPDVVQLYNSSGTLVFSQDASLNSMDIPQGIGNGVLYLVLCKYQACSSKPFVLLR